jgi:hypothetical protein
VPHRDDIVCRWRQPRLPRGVAGGGATATRLRELGPATYTSRDVVDVPVPDAAEVLRVLADAGA